jgi:hypothetical protein
LTNQLAEVGVMLLMFGVGMHFSLNDLLAVKKIAVPGAIVQMAAATLLGMGVAYFWDWPMGQSLVFGLALSVASTVVLLKALEARGMLTSANGQIAVGWLERRNPGPGNQPGIRHWFHLGEGGAFRWFDAGCGQACYSLDALAHCENRLP